MCVSLTSLERKPETYKDLDYQDWKKFEAVCMTRLPKGVKAYCIQTDQMCEYNRCPAWQVITWGR